jgi:hypothetical protein
MRLFLLVCCRIAPGLKFCAVATRLNAGMPCSTKGIPARMSDTARGQAAVESEEESSMRGSGTPCELQRHK